MVPIPELPSTALVTDKIIVSSESETEANESKSSLNQTKASESE